MVRQQRNIESNKPKTKLTSSNPKGWLPKKAAIVLLFLCLPRFICFVGVVFIITGMALTISAYSDNVPYYDKAAGPCLLTFGILFVIAYVIWKHYRRGSSNQSDHNSTTVNSKSGQDNTAYVNSNTNNHINKNDSKVINISSKSISDKQNSGLKDSSYPTTKALSTDRHFLAVNQLGQMASSPVVSFKTRTKRNLENNKKITVEVDLHNVQSITMDEQPGPSGVTKPKNNIYTISTESDDEDF